MNVRVAAASILLVALVALVRPHPVAGQRTVVEPGDTVLYRTELIRAAPGRLLDLIDALGSEAGARAADGERAPWIVRHSQGDHWDLMVLRAVGARAVIGNEGGFGRLDDLVAWRESTYVIGPPPEVVAENADAAGLFHVEMFVALPGKRTALLAQREMENAYLAAVGRPTNLIFRRVDGGPWDLFTVGFYRDMAHFAEPSGASDAEADAAARAAGFEASDRIGTYLRGLIDYHHDTLAVPVR